MVRGGEEGKGMGAARAELIGMARVAFVMKKAAPPSFRRGDAARSRSNVVA
ncbi:hypothetical protein GCM10022281_14290 [Sphingomonas rosea]|uniref:Uncharacterized protein n=1 Tax=Sphingomonas rosea TaxID=335605 RepID=A0ABP7U2X2_9SPHN